jgi:hypothetical protein
METKEACFGLVHETLPTTLSESTRKTYSSVLVNHYMRYGDGSGCIMFFTTPVFLQTLESRNVNTQATILAAAYALTKNANILIRMHAVSKDIKETYKDQTMCEKRKNVALTKAEIDNIFYEHVAKYDTTPTDRNLTDLLITGLMSGVFPELPPRRLMEYTELKPHPPPRGHIASYNYIITGPRGRLYMVINRHKTSKTSSAPHILPVPRELSQLVLKAKEDGREFLFLNEKGEKFTSASLHHRLMGIYGFGVDMLRSVFLSDMHKGTPKLRKMEKVAKLMGNSVNAQVMCYVKK